MDDEGLEAALWEQHPDEVWFSAEELVAKTTVSLRAASPPAGVAAGGVRADTIVGGGGSAGMGLGRGYVTPDELSVIDTLEQEGHLDWGHLPSWPDGPPSGHGLGAGLARSLGPLRPETRLWIDESAALGAGQALSWQLADGLALATAEDLNAPVEAAAPPDGSHPPRTRPAAETFVVLFTRQHPEDLAIAAIARHAGVEQAVLRRGPIVARDSGRWSPFEIGDAFLRARATATALANTGRDRHLRWVCEGDQPFDPVLVVDALATDLAERALLTGRTPWLVVCWDALSDADDFARAAKLHALLRAHPLLARHAVVVVARGPAAAGSEGRDADSNTVALTRHFRSGFTSRLELAWAGTRADEDARVRLVARVSVREPGRGQDVFAGETALAWWPAWGRVEPVESQEP